ncbi:hydroxymethylglutaryl-CoA lyase [Streptosporangium roseum]|uniref:Hydroxymethylglutaryl-CoA lyase n=1 Tax=Streptosporangium roseum (strain ATCC 12428 / DSM 43021 / JCM 3005 / KCTC 9067 / NCIMB 10171 / NRRL 2505 / NI 9100) TaxID=479432 RepID=D2B3P4_STRRD|nr:hydroxymethylglutaryl-CoA lyase [Streptosporangium roseum]ACZ89329.1 hydroxymethylglutaryl-CoA lyase [Streptosporangium roseum DSM 43021]
MTSANVRIVEVGPRDGLQNESVLVGTDAKVAYIEALAAAGLTRIEAVSFVHPRLVPQMADAEQVMARVPRRDGLSYIGLIVNARGLDRALQAGVDEVNVTVVATETFSRRNQGMSIAAALDSFGAVAGRARAAGLRVTATIGASFGCPFEGEVPPGHVAEMVRRCADSGADEIALADTIGVGVPADVRRLTGAVREVTGLPLRFHFHNTRNTGYANALTAVEEGAAALDASGGGIGGCPFAPAATGNIATEDLSYALRRSGVDTGVDLDRLTAAAAYIGERLGAPPPALLGRAGDFPPAPTLSPPATTTARTAPGRAFR